MRLVETRPLREQSGLFTAASVKRRRPHPPRPATSESKADTESASTVAGGESARLFTREL